MIKHTWQAGHGGTHDAKSSIFLLSIIPDPLTIFQIGCATFRRLIVIFSAFGHLEDVRITGVLQFEADCDCAILVDAQKLSKLIG